jgi:DNA-binding HxlR family transcriptional regulator
MTGLRSYGDPCGIARALDVIGERWALLIVRELVYGPKRFSDLRVALGASPNVLTQRLGELEECGVLQRQGSGGSPYDLSDWGRELHPILLELGRWGARASHRPPGTLGVDALLLALESTFDASRAEGLELVVDLRLDNDRFTVRVRHGAIAVARGSPRESDAVIETDPATLRAVAFSDRKLAGAPLEIRGDAARARRFLRSFARP